MFKNIFFIVLLSLFFASCSKKAKEQEKIDQIEVSLKIERFDKILYETPLSNFQEMRMDYSLFFPAQFHDSIFINKIKSPIYRELYSEVQKKYSNFTPVQEELEELFRQIKYNFPNSKTPLKVTTLISEMDYGNKVIYTDSLLLISLDLYLGKEHKFYEFPEYFKKTFERSQIMPDVVTAFSTNVIPLPRENSLISQMVYFGKEMYLKDVLLPNYQDYNKIAFTKEHLEWCKVNESDIWRFFIEEGMLYDTDSKLTQRFIAPAPFSKFYKDLDQDSPGRVGVWIGWQIVKSYMQNNDVSLHELLKTDSKKIFEKSKYKPKKQ